MKSENVYGQTYGKISYQSTAGAIERGIDQAPHLKYNSTFKAEFVKPSERQFETTAQIVGVQRSEDTYKKVRKQLSRNIAKLFKKLNGVDS